MYCPKYVLCQELLHILLYLLHHQKLMQMWRWTTNRQASSHPAWPVHLWDALTQLVIWHSTKHWSFLHIWHIFRVSLTPPPLAHLLMDWCIHLWWYSSIPNNLFLIAGRLMLCFINKVTLFHSKNYRMANSPLMHQNETYTLKIPTPFFWTSAPEMLHLPCKDSCPPGTLARIHPSQG